MAANKAQLQVELDELIDLREDLKEQHKKAEGAYKGGLYGLLFGIVFIFTPIWICGGGLILAGGLAAATNATKRSTLNTKLEETKEQIKTLRLQLAST